MDVETSKRFRLHVGNLNLQISEKEIEQRFQKIGKVCSVVKVVKPSKDGFPEKIFAYVEMEGGDAELNKCVSMFNKVKWKGCVLRVQLAKDSFIKKLEEERAASVPQLVEDVQPSVVQAEAVVEDTDTHIASSHEEPSGTDEGDQDSGAGELEQKANLKALFSGEKFSFLDSSEPDEPLPSSLFPAQQQCSAVSSQPQATDDGASESFKFFCRESLENNFHCSSLPAELEKDWDKRRAGRKDCYKKRHKNALKKKKIVYKK